MTLTTIERRALSRLSTPSGGLLIVAADQRNSMKAVMNAPGGPDSISAEGLCQAKADLVRHLGNQAPAILLDAEVALPYVVDQAILSRDTALVVGMDASGYESVDGLRYTRPVAGITARRARELGGDAAKMLFYLRPDQQSLEDRVAHEVRELVAECEAEGLLLIVEFLTYRLAGESPEQYATVFASLIEGAAEFGVACGAKVLKLPYPGSAESCAAVTRAAQGVPWAVLSAGVDHETFVGQVGIAVEHGASGAMAGRSLWKDALAPTAEERAELLVGKAQPRLAELAKLVG